MPGGFANVDRAIVISTLQAHHDVVDRGVGLEQQAGWAGPRGPAPPPERTGSAVT